MGTLLAVSLTTASWQALAFRRIPPNAVSFSPAGVKIAVSGSASPLIQPLARPTRLAGVRVTARFKGALGGAPSSWGEDSRFRLGLVLEGDRRLAGVKAALAPAWVKKLFSLAPREGGVSRIEFLMMARPPATVGARRVHPSSDLLVERVAWLDDGKDGRRVLEAAVDAPEKVVALWLSVDGDDTGSKYEVLVESIELEQRLPQLRKRASSASP